MQPDAIAFSVMEERVMSDLFRHERLGQNDLTTCRLDPCQRHGEIAARFEVDRDA